MESEVDWTQASLSLFLEFPYELVSAAGRGIDGRPALAY